MLAQVINHLSGLSAYNGGIYIIVIIPALVVYLKCLPFALRLAGRPLVPYKILASPNFHVFFIMDKINTAMRAV